MNGISWSIRGGRLALFAMLLSLASGCTSAISTAYLRDTLWDLSEHASEADPESPATDSEAAAVATDSPDSKPAARVDDAVDAERREAAIDEAVARVKRLGPLDEATRRTLIETLEQTQQEDWPVVVEAFASTLEAADSAQAAAREVVARAEPPVVAASHVVAKADLDGAAVDPPAQPQAPVTAAAATAEESAAASDAEDAAGSQTLVTVSHPEAEGAARIVAASPPTLTVNNACFASRVQGWGVVDRFAESRFHPGQEVIVYFELDNLSAGESPAGHTTCIDATLTFMGADGRVEHEWSFEPIAETCRTQRRDYFARYVITLPESIRAGTGRIEVAVVDTLAGSTARATLPLEVGPADAPEQTGR
ncbi:MAG: hypothetical protein K8S94_07105 [Planctomycetia bacterium]|nr:hypothetical protein [Planctomycetia bacterium]